MTESRLGEIKREERIKQDHWEAFRKRIPFAGSIGDEAMELIISASWRMGYDQGFDVAYDIGYGEGLEDGRPR